ncbi:unnamed protein product [Adineta ricciae]|uniref:Uncharacterized protein n=2 Tax=Adineta ricciae TaxID=249248 RepID=A0A814U1Z7_ADIRI|nr:unnamed protein product [Adineta ricciae]
MHIIGVDVGGTNTDAVLLRIEDDQSPKVVTAVKVVTTSDVFSGLIHAVKQVVHNNSVNAIVVGTTHFINALIQRRDLAKVCILRLCGPATHSIAPMSNWPQDLKHAVDGLTTLVSGGYFFDGSEISSLNEEEIRSTVRRALALNINTFCVSGVFSPCRTDQEVRVGEIIHEESPTAYVTLSHEVAGLGLLERENASILNACLRPLAMRTIGMLKDFLPHDASIFLTRNTGTLLSSEDATRWPVFTFASGPTNSMIGAAHLSGIQNGIVIDVGGTSIDFGVIVNGRPRQTHANIKLVDDIRVNVTVPDTYSLPLGGGTIIHVTEEDQSVQVGPNSVAYQLEQQALAFGGRTVTATDVALAAGLVKEIGHRDVKLPAKIIEQVLEYVNKTVTNGVDRMKTNPEPVPVILCGGGCILIDQNKSFPGVTKIIRPDHFAVCNAVGAALCSVSGTLDLITDLVPTSVDGGTQRKAELDRLVLQVQEQCEHNGARKTTIQLSELELIPLSYHSGGYKHRVQLTAIGQLDLSKFKQNEQRKSTERPSFDIIKELPMNIKPPVHADYTKKQPVFDEKGVWCIDPIDIEYIAYGAGILGCGGGGEVYHSKLWCLDILQQGKHKMCVVPPSYYESSSDLVVSVGFMGVPTVSHELLSSGLECATAVDALEKHLSTKFAGIFSGEIGGANGLMGLIVAANKDLYCIDADGIGRAFPCLTHLLAFIEGCRPAPASLCDIHGDTIMCTEDLVSTPQELEDIFRIECIKRGLIAGVCLPPINGEQLRKYSLAHSVSRAWFLGQAKFNHSKDAVQAVARAGHGRVLVSNGKIINVERNTSDCFVRGHVTIEMQEGNLIIDFQNENLVARLENGDVLASVPDLITLVEQDTAEPLSTETIKYGYRVSVLVLPAPKLLTAPHVLEHIGIKAFGYEFSNYEYVPSYAPIQSVWDVFYKKNY